MNLFLLVLLGLIVASWIWDAVPPSRTNQVLRILAFLVLAVWVHPVVLLLLLLTLILAIATSRQAEGQILNDEVKTRNDCQDQGQDQGHTVVYSIYEFFDEAGQRYNGRTILPGKQAGDTVNVFYFAQVPGWHLLGTAAEKMAKLIAVREAGLKKLSASKKKVLDVLIRRSP